MQIEGNITIPADSDRAYHIPILLSVRAVSDNYPVDRCEIQIKLEGHGSFDSQQVEDSTIVFTDVDGEGLFAWWEYPRFLPRRTLASTITASCARDDVVLTFVQAPVQFSSNHGRA